MISLVIQNIIFAVLVCGLVFIIKILDGKILGLKWILASVLSLWLAGISNIFFSLDLISLSLLLGGIALGIYGLILVSKEKEKNKNRVINSIESAVESIIAKSTAKGIAVIYNGESENSKFVFKYGSEGECLMMTIPIELSDNSTCYVALFGDKPFVNFRREDFESEISFLKLYIENLKLSEKVKFVEDESVKVKNSIYEFVHILAHELKKPLTGIIGFSEILRDEFKNLSDKDIIDFTTNIKRSADEMLMMLKYLAEIVEIETGKDSLNLERFKASEIVDDVLAYFSGEIGRKKLSLVLDIDRDFEIEADRKKFREVVYQLVSNAVKFSYEGGVIKISLKSFDDLVELVVKDEGIGIRREDMQKIFKPFPRIKSHLNGTGLGLALAKYLVELHGGEINVSSEYGKGSEFRVILPSKRGVNKFKNGVVENCEMI